MTDSTARYLCDYQTPQFTITTVDLTFDLTDNKTTVTSKLSITRLNENSSSLVLNGEKLQLLSVRLNEDKLSELDYKVTESQLEIPTQESDFTLTVVTEINPLDNTSLEGLFKSGDAFCTQCEAEGFRCITYYLDRPDVMAIFTTKVIADKAQYPYLLSNGNKVAHGDLENGKHYSTWHDPFPKPSYLFALVAGDFDLLEDNFTTSSNKRVALEIFVDKGNLHKAHHAMKALKDSMSWDECTFGLEYDLDIYMIVAVDFFNMGAMENKGLNVFNSKYVLADTKTATDTDFFQIEAVIAHEYFHNWTGNRVTCRDWFQLSLKEGLTVFRDQQFSADMHSATVTRIKNVRVLRSLQFAEDAGPMAHPIRPEKVMEMNNFYTLTVYEKGSEVIRMLHTLLGQDKFRQGMDLYFERFDGMAVTCDDFVNAMADASGVNLEQFKFWYSQAGTPKLTVNEDFNDVTGQFTLTIKQENPLQSTGSVNLHIPVNIELIDLKAKKSELRLIEIKSAQQSWTFERFDEKPIVGFLGGFSAPVKVDFHQSDDELEAIMVHGKDEFCRWDAGQKLLTNYLIKLVAMPAMELPHSLSEAFACILTSSTDMALKAEQLTLPNFNEVADLIEEVDPKTLSLAITKLKGFLATKLQKLLVATYQQCHVSDFSQDKLALAQRALKNVCLSYLAALPKNHKLITEQYQTANNMTDTLAALTFSAENDLVDYDYYMKNFEEKWQETTLVMDKWFMIAGTLKNDEIFERLTLLIQHPLFTLKNPNRARSLIASFANNNPQYFHCKSGKGYQFLATQISLLDEINPQIASRLITPLIQFKSFDKSHQVLMRNELEQLSLKSNLSKDLKEKLDAALSK